MDFIPLYKSVSITDFLVSPDEEHLVISVFEHGITLYRIDADTSRFTELFHLLRIHNSLIINVMWLNNSKLILQTFGGFYIYNIHSRVTINMFEDETINDVSLFNFIHDNTELVCLHGKNMLAHFSYEGGFYHQTRMVEVPVFMVANIYVSPTETIIVTGCANTNDKIVIYQGTFFNMVHMSTVPDTFDNANPYYTIPMPNRENPTHVLVLFCDGFQRLCVDLYAIIELKAAGGEGDIRVEYNKITDIKPDLAITLCSPDNLTIGYQIIVQKLFSAPIYLFNCLTKELVPVGDSLPIAGSHYFKTCSNYKEVTYKQSTYKKIEATGTGSTYLWTKYQKAEWIKELKKTNILVIDNKVICKRNNKQYIDIVRPDYYKHLGALLPAELIDSVLSYAYC